jgi:hypothetical protein
VRSAHPTTSGPPRPSAARIAPSSNQPGWPSPQDHRRQDHRGERLPGVEAESEQTLVLALGVVGRETEAERDAG